MGPQAVKWPDLTFPKVEIMPPSLSLRVVVLAALFLALLAPATRVAAGIETDCRSEDWERRISGCTAIIENPNMSPDLKAEAYATRALALSLKGQFERSIDDYDAALNIEPNFAVALNNRAWAFHKWGKGPKGLIDVEKSLALNPMSEHTWDTRAHIRQSMGNHAAAFADYEQAANIGGERMVKLYQCGLASQGLYKGRMDGNYSDEVRDALKTCANSKTCDPLPADEECKDPTS